MHSPRSLLFSIDIIDLEKKYDKLKQEQIRKRIHVLMSLVLILIIISFKYLIRNESVIERLFVFAGYTYGPLLGYYSFGLFTKYKIRDNISPFVALIAPILSILLVCMQDTICIRIWFFYSSS